MRGRTRWAWLVAIVMLAATGAALAAPGDLDTSFNGDGSRELSSPDGVVIPNAVAVQSDGRIVVAGNIVTSSGNSSMFVTRLLPGGGDDPTFHGGVPLEIF